MASGWTRELIQAYIELDAAYRQEQSEREPDRAANPYRVRFESEAAAYRWVRRQAYDRIDLREYQPSIED